MKSFSMLFALADESSLPFILEMTRQCIAEMRARGIEQWDDVYPSREVFETDVDAKNLFVLMDDSNTIIGSATLDKKQSDEYMFPVASGIIAGGSLMGVLLIFIENGPDMLKSIFSQ